MSGLIIQTAGAITLLGEFDNSISLNISPLSLPGPQGAAGPRGLKGDTGIGIPSGGIAGQVLAKNSGTDYDSHWITAAGMGDMLSAVYDPTGKNSDAFDADNHVSGTTNKVYTATEKTKLSGIATGATVYTDAMADARVVAGITGKVDKVTGKQLSTEDYTTTEKNKLSGIASGAEVNVNADWNAVSGDAQILNKPTIPTALSELADDSTHRLVTDTEKSTWNGKQDALSAATASNNGYMTQAYASKLDGIASGAEVNVNADWNSSSGDSQILNKPTIPTAVSDLSNDSGFVIGSNVAKITVGTTEPSTPSTGDLWVDTN